MPDDNPSAVAEALPAADFYVPTSATSLPATAREKMLRRGPAALSATDLLTVVLGARSEHAAQRLIRRYGLAGLVAIDGSALARSRRVGKGAAVRLAAVLELHRRLKGTEQHVRPRLTRPREVYDQVRDIAGAMKEHLVGLYLDAQNGLVHRETISVGSLNTTRSHPREILYPAVTHLAHGFILAHNHPSGSLEPSDEDVAFTRAVHHAGELMGIELYDHIIVTPAGFTSLRERGQI